MNSVVSQIIDKIKEAKAEKGITTADISQLSGVPLATLTRILNGKTPNPTLESIVPIAIALGLSIDELMGLKIPEDTPVAAPVVTALDSYAELLKEKDQRIKEKDKTIEMLKDINEKDRIQKQRLLWFIGCFVIGVVFVLFLDVFNGNIGFVRY